MCEVRIFRVTRPRNEKMAAMINIKKLELLNFVMTAQASDFWFTKL